VDGPVLRIRMAKWIAAKDIAPNIFEIAKKRMCAVKKGSEQ
jgi:hypothetical protein